MNAKQVMKNASEAGVLLFLKQGGALGFKVKKGVLGAELKAQIIACKGDIIDLLKQSEMATTPLKSAIKKQADRSQVFPLSFAQQRLWFIDKLQGSSVEYNIPMALEVTGDFKVDVAEQAIRHIIQRHETLRTTFAEQSEQSVQHIQQLFDFKLKSIDYSQFDQTSQQQKTQQLIVEDANTAFDLTRDLMVRASYILLSATGAEQNKEQKGILLFCMHHIASDGWSSGILVNEFVTCYQAALEGKPASLPALAIGYADYAKWQNETLTGEALDKQLSYWREQLANVPAVHSLPLDFARPAIKQTAAKVVNGFLDSTLSKQLQQLATDHQLTPFMLLHGAVALVLSRHSNTHDIVLGTPVANRMQAELEPLIGFFANTLVLRTNTEHQGFAEYLAHVKQVNVDAQANQDVPFEHLVELCNAPRSNSYTPLVQIAFVMDTNQSSDVSLPGLRFSHAEQTEAKVKFDLRIAATMDEQGIMFSWMYDTSIFDEQRISTLSNHLQRLLMAVVQTPQATLRQLTILSKAEVDYLVDELNPAPQNYPENHLVHQLFEQQVQLNPNNVALVCDNEQMTYQALDNAANQLAHYLQSQGVTHETLVGICVERSMDMVVGILAILKAGGAYVPLDPSYPTSRLEYVLNDTATGIVLSQTGLLDKCSLNANVNVIAMNDPAFGAQLHTYPSSQLNIKQIPSSLAYVIYTSGSTGQPKGVLQLHQNVSRLFAITQDDYVFNERDVWTLFHSIAFDFSVWELWGALTYGGKLVIPSYECTRDPQLFVELCQQQKVSVLNQTPSAFSAFVQSALQQNLSWTDLRFVIFGGEALQLNSVQAWWARYGTTGPQLVNMYGITETAVHVSFKPISNETDAATIGKCLGDQTIYLLDDNHELVPPGAVGEIFVGGAGLARGYLNQSELTESRFINNPFASDEMREVGYERMYKTGDLARFDADGQMIYLGRNDHQVKLNGFRIELSETEFHLARCENVLSSLVMIREDHADHKQLVAYVVADKTSETLIEQIKAQLQALLPAHQVPSAFVLLDELPLTANGKVDKNALPALDGAVVRHQYVAPVTDIEKMLCDIWQKVLNLETVGIDDNFFELGGHSLLAMRLINQVQEILGEIIHLVVIFDVPTVAGFAAYLEKNYTKTLCNKGLLDKDALNDNAGDEDWALSDDDLQVMQDLVPVLPTKPPVGRKKNGKAVFILSAPRCGSTLLRVMLGGHPQLFAPPELELLPFDSLSQRSEAFTGRFEFWLEGTLRTLMEIKGCDLDQARKIMADYEQQGLSCQQFYQQLQGSLGNTLLVDKTPSYAYHPAILEQAEACFDEVHYIHLIRHPYGMISSFEKAQLDQLLYLKPHDYSTRQLAELIWTSCQINISAFLATIPLERQKVVEFEKLVSEPQVQMQALCEFLDLDYTAALLNPYDNKQGRMTDGVHQDSRMLGDVKFHSHKKIRQQTSDAWRDQIETDFLSDRTLVVAAVMGYGKVTVAAPELIAINDDGPRALSFAQQRLWFIERMAGQSSAYNIPAAFEVNGNFKVDVAQRSIWRIIERHQALRTVYVEQTNGEAIQVIQSTFDFVLERKDLSALDPATQSAQITTLIHEDSVKPFDLTNDLMVRSCYLQTGEQSGVLLFNMHHIASDGWSVGVLLTEFVTLYQSFAQGQTDPLPELAIQYSDYAHWQRQWISGSVLARQLDYWVEQLADVPAVHGLLLDKPRGEEKTYQGAQVTSSVDAQLSQRLQQVARDNKLTLFMLLQAAWALVLSRHSNSHDIVMGTPVANRTQPALESLIGFFVNTLVLRVDTGHNTLTDYLAHVRKVHLGAQSHQDIPFEQLVEQCKVPRSKQHTPLFQIMFMINTLEQSDLSIPGVRFNPLPGAQMVAKFDLDIGAQVSDEGIDFSWVYDTSLFNHDHIESLSEDLNRLLSALVEKSATQPLARLADLPMLSAQQQHHLVDELNRVKSDYPQDKCIHQLFEAQAQQNPDNLALVFGEHQLTYQALNHSANHLAHYLQTQGVERGMMVGIYINRSLEMMVAMLAILKTGGIYVPFDLEFPQARLNHMLQDTGVKHILTQSALVERLDFVENAQLPVQIVAFDDSQLVEQMASCSNDNLVVDALPTDSAYINYTSGSTGTPKGVLTPHIGVIRVVVNPGFISLDGSTRFLQSSSISFDAATLEIWGPLLNGGCCVLYPQPLMDLTVLNQTIEQQKINTVWMTAGLFEQWSHMSESMTSLRYLLAGGDIVDPGAVRRVQKALPSVQLVNGYGPTESTTFACCYPIPVIDEQTAVISIGQPINGTSVYLLSDELQLVPKGCVGELYIGGMGLANGYLNQAQLSAEAFINNPFGEGRLYKTGDLVRYTSDDNLVFVGRADSQVKIRGYRIELGEIENCLLQCDNVQSAVVIALDDERLVAYVVAQTAEHLKISLQTQLPAFMVPSAFVLLDELPLTANGKIDTKALPLPDGISLGGEYVPAKGEIEQGLVEIWAELLKLDGASVSATANFFELGGHSLLAVRLVAKIRELWHIEVTINTLFDEPTVQALAVVIDRAITLAFVKTQQQNIEIKSEGSL